MGVPMLTKQNLQRKIELMAKKGWLSYFDHKPKKAKKAKEEKTEFPRNQAELPAVTYSAKLNPFKSASSKVKLDESENAQLNEFLKKAVSAPNIDELSIVVDTALESGIRINAYNENGLSFSNIVISKMYRDGFSGNEQKNIIRKLALSGAEFDAQVNPEMMEICNKIQNEVKPQVHDRLKKLKEIGESAAIQGTVENVEIDNKTFHIEFSPNSRVEVAKVISGTQDLGLSKGNLNLGGSLIKIGNGEFEVKTRQDGTRDYVDISDNSAFSVTFPTSLGQLNIKMYHDAEHPHLIKIEVENENTWSELQRIGETVGNGCLFGGMSVKTAIEAGGFIRPGSQMSTETVRAIPKSQETVSWAERTKSDGSASMVRS